MKRAVCLLVLFSMVLHCASRLGLVAYLYDHRHEIAFSMGWITSMPITICETEYFTKDAPFRLVIPDNPADEQMPVQHFQTREIVLFAVETGKSMLPLLAETDITHNTGTGEIPYPAPARVIFHPPC